MINKKLIFVLLLLLVGIFFPIIGMSAEYEVYLLENQTDEDLSIIVAFSEEINFRFNRSEISLRNIEKDEIYTGTVIDKIFNYNFSLRANETVSLFELFRTDYIHDIDGLSKVLQILDSLIAYDFEGNKVFDLKLIDEIDIYKENYSVVEYHYKIVINNQMLQDFSK